MDFAVIACAQTAHTQQKNAFEHIPLEAGARQIYAVFQRCEAVFPSKEVYSIVTKSVKRDGRDIERLKIIVRPAALDMLKKRRLDLSFVGR